MKTSAFLVALEIDRVDVGAVYASLPLNCTVMPWFRTSRSETEVLKIVDTICMTNRPVELFSSEYALFGRNGNVPVHTLVRTADLISLHITLHQLFFHGTYISYIRMLVQSSDRM